MQTVIRILIVAAIAILSYLNGVKEGRQQIINEQQAQQKQKAIDV